MTQGQHPKEISSDLCLVKKIDCYPAVAWAQNTASMNARPAVAGCGPVIWNENRNTNDTQSMHENKEFSTGVWFRSLYGREGTGLLVLFSRLDRLHS